MINHETDDIENEPPIPLPWWVRLGRILIALIALAGILYLSGVHQYFLFQRTSPTVQQPPLASKVTAEELIIPVHVYILSGTPGSERTAVDAQRLVENANNIWAQAQVTFVIQDTTTTIVTDNERAAFELQPHEFIAKTADTDRTGIHLYLNRTLRGVNGLAYGGTNAVAVADYTSTLDFRTLAHEFGHALGLEHVSDHHQLMSSGATGTDLSLEEIATARVTAQQSFSSP